MNFSHYILAIWILICICIRFYIIDGNYPDPRFIAAWPYDTSENRCCACAGLEKSSVRRTKITSADWFNPDRSGFYRQLGLEETFSFQDGIDLLCERCPNLRRVMLLQYQAVLRIWIH